MYNINWARVPYLTIKHKTKPVGGGENVCGQNDDVNCMYINSLTGLPTVLSDQSWLRGTVFAQEERFGLMRKLSGRVVHHIGHCDDDSHDRRFRRVSLRATTVVPVQRGVVRFHRPSGTEKTETRWGWAPI